MRVNNYMKRAKKKAKGETPSVIPNPPSPPPLKNNQSIIDSLMQSIVEKHSQKHQAQEAINDILLDIQPKRLIDSQEDVEQVKNFLTEYMNCFILFGYDANKNRVYIRYAANQSDEDALIEALRKIVMNYI